MKPAPFRYEKAESSDHLVELLGTYGLDAKILAGGQSLMPMMNMRLASPAVIVDINEVPGWDQVALSAERLTLGSLVRHRTIERHAAIKETLPILAEAARHIAHPVIRNRGTIGGSLAHADPSAEHLLTWTLLDGLVTVLGPRGSRTIGTEELVLTYLTTTLEPDEVIQEVAFPRLDRDTGWAFREVSETRGAFALVAAGALVDENRVVLAVSGGGPVPVKKIFLRSIASLGPDAAADLVEELLTEFEPESDLHASDETRRRLARELGRRVILEAAAERRTRYESQ